MNIHIKYLSYDQFRRVKQGLDSVDHLQKANFQQLLVRTSDRIKPGDLIVIRVIKESRKSPLYQHSLNMKPLLAKVISVGYGSYWQNYGVRFAQIRLIPKETIDQL